MANDNFLGMKVGVPVTLSSDNSLAKKPYLNCQSTSQIRSSDGHLKRGRKKVVFH